MSSKFKIGDFVSLTFDKSKRFIVANDAMLDNESITVTYFNEAKGKMDTALIPEKYLIKVISEN